MVEMSNSGILVERKPTYTKGGLHDTSNVSMIKDSSRFLNGDVSYFSKERSNSDCSTDSRELDSLLEVADNIKNGKNGLQKPKKRVRFNMDNNQEFSYSYAAHNDSSDDEKLANIHFVGYEYMNGDNESDDDDDDYDDEEEEEEESDENDYDTETSEEGCYTGLGKYGYLVDKTSEREQEDKSSLNKVNKSQDEEIKVTNRFDGKTECDNEPQMEKMIQSRKDAVEGEISDLTRQLVKFREETQQEMNHLQNELELRRKQYNTEIEEITRHRQQQKRKFEEELEEFQNEKKLEERRQRYHEHEGIISEKEQELTQRKAQVVEQEREIREYEEYLDRRHTVCNSKEQDLNVLQNELDTLSRELEVNKERLLNKSLSYQRQLENLEDPQNSPPINDKLMRRASRMSTVNRVELRLEELKHQNKQLLEELFSLKKTLENKDEELGNSRQTMDVLSSENKRLSQKVKNLESQLELSRKTAEFHGSDSPTVEDILRKNATEMRNSRVSRASRVHLEPLHISSSHTRLSRSNSGDSEYSKIAKSSSSGESNGKVSSRGRHSGSSDEKQQKHSLKHGTEKTTSSLCAVM